MRLALLNLAALVAVAAMHGEARADETINLGVGASRTLTIPGGISKLAIAKPEVADVKPIGSNQIYVVGKSEGRTDLTVFKSNGSRVTFNISVSQVDKDKTVEDIKKLLNGPEGITVKMAGEHVLLDGQAYTTEDYERVEQVMKLYPNNLVVSFVKMAGNAKKLAANNLNAALQKAGLKNVQASVVGATIFLEGSVESQQDLQKAEMITKAIGEKVENLLVVGIKRMVLSEVQFVEIRRNDKEAIGITWPLDISGKATVGIQWQKQYLPQPGGAANVLMTNNIIGSTPFGLHMAFNNGYGRMLAQPKLVCASGEKAEFLAGGEIPIPLITQNQMTVQYKEYGVKLKLQPTADRHGNIQTLIEAEVSQVDDSLTVEAGANKFPGFLTRKVHTNVTVRHGETIVLSGLFSHDEGKSVGKIPGLGHIPIIGELFKQRDFTSTKRELVIFVTPRIVNPDTERIRKMIQDIKTRYKAAHGEVNFNIFD